MEEKKIIRNFGIFAAAVIVAAGCAKEMSPSPDNKVTVLTAGLEATKTVLDGKKVYWTGGDRISVNGITSEELAIENPSATAEFRLPGELNPPYKAVFPASVFKDENTVTMPSVQEYNETSFHAQASPMIAFSTTGNLVFSHPFSVICLSINQKDVAEKISYVEFRGNDNEQVCGDFVIDYDKKTLTATGADSKNKAVRVNVNKALSADAPTLVHIVVPAMTYSKGFSVKIVDGTGRFMEKSVQTERVYAGGTVYDMAPFDFEPADTDFSVEITSAADLISFANAWNTGEYTSTPDKPLIVRLTRDIEFSAEDNAAWQGIGVNADKDADDKFFDGVFDGGGNTISGFTSTKSLFSYVGVEGTVRNLSLSGEVTYDLTGISEETNVAPFIHRSWGMIEGCSSSVDVTVTSSSEIRNEVRIAGLLAYMTNGKCNGCSYSGSLKWEGTSSSSARAYVGGVVGYVNSNNASLSGCYLSGTIDLSATVTGDRSWFGGVVGYPMVPVTDCYTTENARLNVSNATKLRFGGVVGYAASTVTGCVNNAPITINCPSSEDKTHTYAGGIVGRNAAEVSKSDNNGTITVTAGALNQRVGGIVGQNYGSSITDCKNSGAIICNDVVVKKLRYYGGVAGYSDGTVSSCRNSAAVSSASLDAEIGEANRTSNMVGGIVAYFCGSSLSDCTNSGTVSNQYWNNSNALETIPYTGGIAANVIGKEGAEVTVSNCVNVGSAGSEVKAKRGICGGIVGYADYVIVSNCDNTMNVTGSSYYAGGVVGQMAQSSVSGCDVVCDIKSTQMRYGGGIAGRTTKETTSIDNCSYDGDITSTYSKTSGVGAAAGGNTGTLTVSGSRFRGTMTYNGTTVTIIDVSDAETSNICGLNNGTITITGNSLIQ